MSLGRPEHPQSPFQSGGGYRNGNHKLTAPPGSAAQLEPSRTGGACVITARAALLFRAQEHAGRVSSDGLQHADIYAQYGLTKRRSCWEWMHAEGG